MKKIGLRLTAVLLILMLLSASFVTVYSAASAPTTYSKQYNSGTRDVVCTTLSGTSAAAYYANYNYDNLSQLSQSQLFSQLQTLMRSTHDYISSYDDCHYKANKTDCTNGSQNVSLIYTSYSATMSQWNGWNREHVWPQSLGGGNTKGGGADLHHIRPSDSGVNSSRGNKKYGDSGDNPTQKKGTDPAVGVLGGTYNGTYFEPLDNVKGDVARICLYVYVRWNSDWGASSITKVFQSVDVLLEWCELDPVDTWEMGRNEVVGDIQGNRNVFIDYPEYAWLIFGREVPTDMTTPSGKAATSTSNPGTSNPGTTDPGTSNPGTSNPGTTDPGTSNPGTTDPGTSNPGTTDPGTSNPGTTDPGTSNPGVTDPGTSNPGTSSPDTTPEASTPESTPPNMDDCSHSFGEWEELASGLRVRTCSECGFSEASTKKQDDAATKEGCEAAVYETPVVIVSVVLLGFALTARKKKRVQ